MSLHTKKTGVRLALATATALTASIFSLAPFTTAAVAQVTTQRPTGDMAMSIGRAQIINLPSPASDVVVSNPGVLDVQVRTPTQLYLFAKGSGETSFFVTARDGRVIYSANVRVAQNLNSLGDMLAAAMPEASIKATTMNGLVLLTGTVASPEDVVEAERLAKAFAGSSVEIVSRLRTATPLQVNLQVKISEVSRDFMKRLGVNLLTRDSPGGFLFGIANGRNFGSISDVTNPVTGAVGTQYNFSNLNVGGGTTSIGLAGKLLGLDIMSAIDIAETDGLATTLAAPTLTALSGETASFLAGGEIPIPIAQGQGQLSVDYKQYGVSLQFTPLVLSNGRISLRVKPEVSQLSFASSVNINGVSVPGLSTRRAETTIELGSGQSFMIAGLLMSSHNNSIEKAPGLGDIPILGALFRSTTFRRNETELVIVVTPYLVKPVSANEIALPTDGYKSPTDVERVFLGQTESSRSGGARPVPKMGAPVTVPEGGQNPSGGKSKKNKRKAETAPVAAPGFGE